MVDTTGFVTYDTGITTTFISDNPNIVYEPYDCRDWSVPAITTTLYPFVPIHLCESCKNRNNCVVMKSIKLRCMLAGDIEFTITKCKEYKG